jgi:branched-subunit amino acid permease
MTALLRVLAVLVFAGVFLLASFVGGMAHRILIEVAPLAASLLPWLCCAALIAACAIVIRRRHRASRPASRAQESRDGAH